MKRLFHKRFSAFWIGIALFIGLPVSHAVCWQAANFLWESGVQSLETGTVVGMSLGGGLVGLVIALVLRKQYPEMRRLDMAILIAGWALAMFVVAGLTLIFWVGI